MALLPRYQVERIHALKCPGSISSMGGTILEHSSIATGHRGWKRQPGGTLIGLGVSPCKINLSLRRRGFGTGMTDIKAFV
jgi:hypothetical protein